MSKLKEKRNKFEILAKDVNLGIGTLFKKLNRVTCPCCGYPTIVERASYEICELCNWEDDGQDDEDSSRALGGPNSRYSLDEARENFIKYRIMYSPDNNTTITGGDSAERENIKKKLIEIFEEMLQTNKHSDTGLWKRALRVEKELDLELERSIRAYEKSIKT